jgi:hypothetical protein
MAYDTPAKEALVKLLEAGGHTIESTVENYNADVVSSKDGLMYYNEAEVKTGWKEEWPPHWAEIRLPERKKRLVKMYEEREGVLNFYIFRPDFKQVWRIKDTLLKDSSLRVAKGRYITHGERFFHIPYGDAELIKL